MIDDRVEPLTRLAEPRQTPSHDEIANAFVESLQPLLQLANLAYAYSSIAVSAGRRRALERVGMRAIDLLTELSAFVKDEI
jgi:hypothetical protein